MKLDGKVAVVTGSGNAAERFLIATQPGLERVLIDKGTDYDAWIGQTTPQSLGRRPAAGR